MFLIFFFSICSLIRKTLHTVVKILRKNICFLEFCHKFGSMTSPFLSFVSETLDCSLRAVSLRKQRGSIFSFDGHSPVLASCHQMLFFHLDGFISSSHGLKVSHSVRNADHGKVWRPRLCQRWMLRDLLCVIGFFTVYSSQQRMFLALGTEPIPFLRENWTVDLHRTHHEWAFETKKVMRCVLPHAWVDLWRCSALVSL